MKIVKRRARLPALLLALLVIFFAAGQGCGHCRILQGADDPLAVQTIDRGHCAFFDLLVQTQEPQLLARLTKQVRPQTAERLLLLCIGAAAILGTVIFARRSRFRVRAVCGDCHERLIAYIHRQDGEKGFRFFCVQGRILKRTGGRSNVRQYFDWRGCRVGHRCGRYRMVV